MIKDLQFVRPEDEGLSSEQVLNFINKLERLKINLHSFMITRNGKILTEAYYKPFDENFAHRIYSSSKTYVALAIGKLIGDGKLKLSDKISDFFPELVPKNISEWRKNTTVEDALKMAVPALTDAYVGEKERWAWSFFNLQPDLKPSGTVFNYDTSGTFILCVLIEKLTGKNFLEVLRPIFDEIGVSKDIWCVSSPDGYAWGGSGVVTTLRDFAKVGELLLHKGKVGKKQLIPLDYMEKAVSKQISDITINQATTLKTYGYGYQTWITSEGFAMRGMGGQLVFCFPQKDFMFVCQGDTQSDFDFWDCLIYEAAVDYLYNNLDKAVLSDGGSYEALQKKLSTLEPVASYGEAASPLAKQIDGVVYDLLENEMGWKNFKIEFNGDEASIIYENKRGVKRFAFGLNKWVQGTFPETDYYDTRVYAPAGRGLNYMASASWISQNQLLIRVYIIDTNFGNCFMTFGFKGDEVGLHFTKRAEFFLDDYVGYGGGKKRK